MVSTFRLFMSLLHHASFHGFCVYIICTWSLFIIIIIIIKTMSSSRSINTFHTAGNKFHREMVGMLEDLLMRLGSCGELVGVLVVPVQRLGSVLGSNPMALLSAMVQPWEEGQAWHLTPGVPWLSQ